MVKSSDTPGGGGGAGAGGRGASAIVDVVHRRRSDRLAKLTFVTLLVVLAPVVTLVAATVTDVWLALLIGIVSGFVVAAVAAVVVLVWPVLRMVWYWAGEILLAVLLVGGYGALTLVVPWPVAAVLVAALVAVPLLLPGSRRVLLGWCWCAISRHRLRTCFATFIRANRYGSLPLILLARPTSAGERVWVWLRPGLSLEDLTTESGLDRLAVGCWAHQVKIVPGSRRWAALLRVDITRRRPLAAAVTSPLPHLLGDWAAEDPPVSPAPAGAATGLNLDDIPTPSAPAAAGSPGPRRNGKPSRPAPAPGPATTVDDMSEWV